MSNMKIPLILLAALVISIASVASAPAEEEQAAEWLANAKEIKGGEAIGTDTKAELFIEDNQAPFVGKAAILCSMELAGTVGKSGTDETRQLFNLNIEKIGELPSGLSLLGTGAGSGVGSECTAVTGCEPGTAASPIQVWPVGLPWTSLLVKSGGKWFDLLSTGKVMGFALLCFGNKVDSEDMCTFPNNDATVEVLNEKGNAVFSSNAAFTQLATCSLANRKSGVFKFDAPAKIILGTGEALTVS